MVTIFFLTIYSVTSFSITLKYHYCGAVLTNISISYSDGRFGCDGKAFAAKDCCQDKTICIKINNLNATSQTANLIPNFHLDECARLADSNYTPLINCNNKQAIPFNRHQRLIPKTIYLLNRDFRI